MANEVKVIFQIDQDQQGRTALRQIDRGIDQIGRTAKQTGSGLESSLAFFKSAIILEFFRRGIAEAFAFGQAAVEAFNEARSAALGLESVAKFKGIAGGDAVEAVKNLDLVKNGLLGVGDASTTLKNLLASGFSLPQSIELIKRLGDAAAFGKQSALSFGDAVKSASEGIKNQNSILVDNAGVTKNLSVILKERGFELQDLSDKIKGAAAREALYNGLLVETQGQLGDAAKLTNEFAGGQAKLEAAQQKLLVSVGELITKNPALNESFQSLAKSLEIVTLKLQDSNSELSQLVTNATTTFAALVRGSAELLANLEKIIGVLRDRQAFGVAGGLLTEVFGVQTGGNGVPAEFLERVKKAQEAVNKALSQQGQTVGKPAGGVDREKANKDLLKFAKEQETVFAELEKQGRGAEKAIADLQAKLQINPVVGFFDAANQRQLQFLENFKKIPVEMVEAFKKANRDALALDLFKGTLGQAGTLNRLLQQRADLEGGGDVFRGAARRQAIEDQIRQAQEFLGVASNAAQRQLALENILAATSDVGSLSGDQKDIRRRALDEQITVQRELFRENFNKLKDQTDATAKNTDALAVVGNRLTDVDSSLLKFSEKPITILLRDESNNFVTVNLGAID